MHSGMYVCLRTATIHPLVIRSIQALICVLKQVCNSYAWYVGRRRPYSAPDPVIKPDRQGPNYILDEAVSYRACFSHIQGLSVGYTLEVRTTGARTCIVDAVRSACDLICIHLQTRKVASGNTITVAAGANMTIGTFPSASPANDGDNDKHNTRRNWPHVRRDKDVHGYVQARMCQASTERSDLPSCNSSANFKSSTRHVDLRRWTISSILAKLQSFQLHHDTTPTSKAHTCRVEQSEPGMFSIALGTAAAYLSAVTTWVPVTFDIKKRNSAVSRASVPRKNYPPWLPRSKAIGMRRAPRQRAAEVIQSCTSTTSSQSYSNDPRAFGSSLASGSWSACCFQGACLRPSGSASPQVPAESASSAFASIAAAVDVGADGSSCGCITSSTTISKDSRHQHLSSSTEADSWAGSSAGGAQIQTPSQGGLDTSASCHECVLPTDPCSK